MTNSIGDKLMGIAVGGLLVLSTEAIYKSLHHKYLYKGEIEGDKVSLYETGYLDKETYLEVERLDGKKIKYIDYTDDGNIDEALIKDKKKIIKYSNSHINVIEQENIKKAQRDFDGYLRKIYSPILIIP